MHLNTNQTGSCQKELNAIRAFQCVSEGWEKNVCTLPQINMGPETESAERRFLEARCGLDRASHELQEDVK